MARSHNAAVKKGKLYTTFLRGNNRATAIIILDRGPQMRLCAYMREMRDQI